MNYYDDYEFKFAKIILKNQYAECFQDVDQAIREAVQDERFRVGRGSFPKPAQILGDKFPEKGWKKETEVAPSSGRWKFDLTKSRVAVEIQFADPDDCYKDYLKFLLAYNLGTIDVGIEIVYGDGVRVPGTNIPRLARVKNDLDSYRQVIHCPIWVIGVRSWWENFE